MIWILLSISVAFLKALSELAGKIFTHPDHKKSIDETLLWFWVRAIVVIPALLLCLYEWLSLNIQSSFWLIILWALGNAITTITALKAVKYGDLSLVWPLWSLTIPLLFVSWYFLTWEFPNLWGFVWVFIIFIWTYFLAFDRKTLGILEPFKHIYSDLWARYMFITTIIWALTTPIDKLWVEAIWVFHWLLYLNIFAAIFLWIYIFLFKKNIKISWIFQRSNVIKVWAIALLLWLGNILQLLALKYTLVVYVIAIKRASWVFSVLLWALYFKEKNISWKLFAVSLMVAWVSLIIWAWNI